MTVKPNEVRAIYLENPQGLTDSELIDKIKDRYGIEIKRTTVNYHRKKIGATPLKEIASKSNFGPIVVWHVELTENDIELARKILAQRSK